MKEKNLPKLSASAEEILDILGEVDNETIEEIIRTGASIDDVRKALEWEEEEEYIAGGPEQPEGRVKLVYDILKDDREIKCKTEDEYTKF